MTVPRLAELLRTTLALEKIDLLKKVNSGEEKLIEAMILNKLMSHFPFASVNNRGNIKHII